MPETTIFGVVVIALLAWLIYFRPKNQDKNDALIFDNRVLATIDGLYLSGMKFGCTDFEMRAHARRLLEKAHTLPDNEFLLEHTITDPNSNWNDYTFRSHIGLYGEHITFALLCIIDHADNEELIVKCEQLLIQARHTQIPY